MVYGEANFINETGKVIGRFPAAQTDLKKLRRGYVHIPQQAGFWRADLWKAVGPLDPSFYFAMDYDLWVRLARTTRLLYVPDHVWANFRLHATGKSYLSDSRCWPEMLKVHYRDGGSWFSIIQAKYLVRKMVAPLWRMRMQRRIGRAGMNWLFRSPSFDEVIHLLAAWRIWLLGALLGGIAACLVYIIFPPPYRAQVTVLIDHNIEQVILEEDDDTRRFNYLQEENEKLIQVAWSDQVLEKVSQETGIAVEELMTGLLHLSQPGDGGWHFLADSPDPQQAQAIASAWGNAFYDILAEGGPGINPIMQFDLVQAQDLDPERSVSWGVYLFFGSLAG